MHPGESVEEDLVERIDAGQVRPLGSGGLWKVYAMCRRLPHQPWREAYETNLCQAPSVERTTEVAEGLLAEIHPYYYLTEFLLTPYSCLVVYTRRMPIGNA